MSITLDKGVVKFQEIIPTLLDRHGVVVIKSSHGCIKINRGSFIMFDRDYRLLGEGLYPSEAADFAIMEIIDGTHVHVSNRMEYRNDHKNGKSSKMSSFLD